MSKSFYVSNIQITILSTMAAQSKKILAVGLNITLNPEQLRLELSKYIPKEQLATYEFIPTQKAGFLYGEDCKVGRWSGIKVEQQQLKKWFADYKGQLVTAYFVKMYFTPKVIIFSGSVQGKYFSVIVSNMTTGTQTFLHKKNADSGVYGTPVEIDRIALMGTPYIHYSDNTTDQ
jgi:hypothetical protein